VSWIGELSRQSRNQALTKKRTKKDGTAVIFRSLSGAFYFLGGKDYV